MVEKKRLTLGQMETGQSGTIVEILGGRRLTQRLEAIGIRPSKRVTKISSMLFRGPVTLKVDSTHAAIGFGMASKVIVEVDLPA